MEHSYNLNGISGLFKENDVLFVKATHIARF